MSISPFQKYTEFSCTELRKPCLFLALRIVHTVCRYVDPDDINMRQVATLLMYLPTAEGNEQRIICVKLQFGKTEVCATAVEESTQQAVETTFKFARSA